MRGRGGPGPIAVALVVALTLATAVAVVAGQELRRDGTVFSGTRVINCARAEFADDKTCESRPRKVKPGDSDLAVCFKPGVDDSAEAALLDPDGVQVRLLAGEVRVRTDRRKCLTWNGRDDAGGELAAGSYRLQLSFAEADRTAIAGEPVKLPRRRAGA